MATRSSSAWAFSGSPGPKFTAGMPRALKRATSVQPYFGRAAPPTAAHELLRERGVEPGPGPLGLVDDRELVLGEQVAHDLDGLGHRCGSARSGSSRAASPRRG